jgi:hypothetical protein
MIRTPPFLSRILQVAVFAYQVMAVAAFIAAIFLARFWLAAPFLGAFYEHTMVFNEVGPVRPSEAWDLYNQGVKLGDRLMAVNGVRFARRAM